MIRGGAEDPPFSAETPPSFGGPLRLSTRMRIAVAVFLTVLAGRSAAASLVVFGDSLSDTGTIEFVLASLGEPSQAPPPYYAGRFSNGPLYVEQLGYPVDPAVLGGTNFAAGGARTSSHVGGGLASTLSLAGQLEFFRSTRSGVANPQDIYLVWIGGNDVRQGILSGDPGSAANLIGEGLDTLKMVLLDLREMGARQIIVPTVPDIGRTPQFVDDPLASSLGSDLSRAWNGGLEEIVASLDDPDVQLFDAFGFLNGLADDPARHGFTNTSDQALLNLDQDADEFLFWDEIHPTARVHQLLAEELKAQLVIPEPLSWTLSGTALLVLLSIRRRG